MKDPRMHVRRKAAWAGIIALPLLALALMLGLRRDLRTPGLHYPKQMAASPAYLPQTANPVFASGTTQRAPAPGTLPRGVVPFHYGPGDVERARAGRELRDPLPESPEVLERGKALYETFCSVCHGMAGAGDGPVIGKFPNPPDLRLPASRDLPDGALFHTITLGRNNMPANAAQLTTVERWQVIRYLRRLQGGGTAAPDSGGDL